MKEEEEKNYISNSLDRIVQIIQTNQGTNIITKQNQL